jgi:hypothetical protein
MNQRIKELADKVADLMPGVYNVEYESGKSGVEFTEDALEKFAELLIRECAVVALNHHLHGLPETSADTAIKTHFGVSE